MDGIVISLGRGAVLNILYSDSSSIFTGTVIIPRQDGWHIYRLSNDVLSRLVDHLRIV